MNAGLSNATKQAQNLLSDGSGIGITELMMTTRWANRTAQAAKTLWGAVGRLVLLLTNMLLSSKHLILYWSEKKTEKKTVCMPV
jgi:hypothetical protein